MITSGRFTKRGVTRPRPFIFTRLRYPSAAPMRLNCGNERLLIEHVRARLAEKRGGG